MKQFFAPCPRGLETVLCDELRAIGANDAVIFDGGASFRGNLEIAYRVNLESRIASRILLKILECGYENENDLYRETASLPWDAWFSPDLTIKVALTATKSRLNSLDFATLRIKDALCDKFRQSHGKRPSVDTVNPDIRIHAHLTSDRFSLYIDTSGDALFKRGLRQSAGDAPLRENLAAGILHLSGWKPGIPLLDPMCGSGTFLMEAAQMALSIAPGSGRSFAFEKLANFDRQKWEAIRNQSLEKRKPVEVLKIFGSDILGRAIETARKNLIEAGLEKTVELKQANFLEMSAPMPNGIIVTNPPYGVRMGEGDELAALYPRIGDALKKKFSGWNAYFFTADMRLPKLIRLSTSRRIPLYNGALECRLFEYRMVEGGNRKVR
ncbi:MAG: class I SAM-dependent RNA methyltransferase [Burkholderiales bacterium]|nr:class I SAM-dependent RNA methyltransferase [Burkholderiales bacterium]